MKSILKSSSLVLALALIASVAMILGCVDQGNESSNTSAQNGVESVDHANITNIKWQWAGTIDTSSNQSVVPNKEQYTLEFLPDSTYSITTDCNSGSGNYTLDGKSLTLGPGMITLVYCGEQSLEPQYLSLLGSVTSMTLEDGQLLLSVGNNSEKMVFINPSSV
ncbi:MAG: META domain-containing protein [Methanomethylovorans sp.]|uniref:META domain-containing protein n=1 Tax=Methanomethylovorans sp. TaxID=2758717 RepID=UPI0035314049